MSEWNGRTVHHKDENGRNTCNAWLEREREREIETVCRQTRRSKCSPVRRVHKTTAKRKNAPTRQWRNKRLRLPSPAKRAPQLTSARCCHHLSAAMFVHCASSRAGGIMSLSYRIRYTTSYVHAARETTLRPAGENGTASSASREGGKNEEVPRQ